MSYQTGLTTQPHELTDLPLTVEGTIPHWIRGTLLRNGPGQFEVGEVPIHHWFDGLAMLHAFRIEASSVRYSNRFLRSKAYVDNNQTGRINYVGFAQDPCRALFGRVMAMFAPPKDGNNAVVNITRLGEAFIAMTESPMTVRFDPHTLETLGVLDYNDAVAAQTATAHPHYDPARGLGINLMTQLGRQTRYQLYGLTDTQRRLIGEFSTPYVSYMHSFGLTPRYAVIVQFSLRITNMLHMLLSGKPFIHNFHYDPQADTVFTIMELDSGRVVADIPADAFFCFHHVNAYEAGDSLMVDLLAYHNADIIDQFYMDRLCRSNRVDVAELRRYCVPLAGGRATFETLCDLGLELPRINYRRNGQPYRYVYATATPRHAPKFLHQLAKVDTFTRSALVWEEENCYPSEAVFLSAPDATSEDDGVVLSVVLDGRVGRSFLLVLDARTWRELGRAQVPQSIPFGFHGQFYGDLL